MLSFRTTWLVYILYLADLTSTLFISQENLTKDFGTTFLVICKDERGRPVSWNGPKGPLGPKTRPKVQIASFGTAVLFNGTTLEDTGTYVCRSPSEEKEFHLKVEPPLTFMDTPATQYGSEGEDVTLRCEVSGGRATWSSEGGEITGSRFKILGDGLLIRNVHKNDSRNYTCKAIQQNTGTIVDKTIKFTVHYKPRFTNPSGNQTEEVFAYIKGIRNLTCEVDSDPPPNFEWFQKHKEVPKIAKYFNSTYTSVLQLYLEPTSFGAYKCVAWNKLGKVEKIFSLVKGTAPDPPSYIELRGANSDLLDIGIHGPEQKNLSSDLMQVTGFCVKYRPVRNDKIVPWEKLGFTELLDNYLLKKLQHNTVYEVMAASVNLAGLSNFTNSSYFKTLPSNTNNNNDKNGIYSFLPLSLKNILLLYLTFLFW